MRAFSVIGAGLGDEGKGATVDALAASLVAPLVVRHNGGAQAGHTVTTPEGVRHVFSHIGSGALAGAPTYLSPHFVVNPRCFINELVELVKYAPQSGTLVAVNPLCKVTTPYDVMVNRWLENHRGPNKHGSVGIGFGETIERYEEGPSLDLWGLAKASRSGLLSYLGEVRHWARKRMEQLGIRLEPGHEAALRDEAVVEDWVENFRNMVDEITITNLDHVLQMGHPKADSVIFEGAQGLLLDQTRGYEFPYVTRSNTGLRNAMILANTLGVDKMEVRYVTRAYSTRHGAGPLEGEVTELEGINVGDPTNTTKPWQDHLRVAPLMTKRISAAVEADLKDASQWPISLNPMVMMTCMDQVEASERQLAIIDSFTHHCPVKVAHISYGPTRLDHQKNLRLDLVPVG